MSVTQEDRLSCYELQVLRNFMFVKLESQVSHKQLSTTTVLLILMRTWTMSTRPTDAALEDDDDKYLTFHFCHRTFQDEQF